MRFARSEGQTGFATGADLCAAGVGGVHMGTRCVQ